MYLNTMNQALKIEFHSYNKSVPDLLNQIGALPALAKQTRILLKPNLVTSSPFPITTSPDMCKAVIEYLRKHSPEAEIVIGEGCGEADLETDEIFDMLGYVKLSKQTGVSLIDLNHAPLTTHRAEGCKIFQEMYLPEIVFTHYVISLPVLKAHSLSVITGAMKNMIGIAPPRYYSGRFGIWKKAVFHEHIHEAIIDLNRHRSPDLTIIDASIGMPDYHLGGRHCDPPIKKLIGGFSPTEVDRLSATLLGLDWHEIPYLLHPIF